MQGITPSDTPNRSVMEQPVVRLLLSIVGLATLVGVIWLSIGFMSQKESPKWAAVIVALVVGIFGIWLFFYFTDSIVGQFPDRVAAAIRPYVFTGPALLLLTAFLVYPTINTTYLSFFNRDSSKFVGLANYIRAFTDEDFLLIFRNNILWLLLVTGFAVSFGLLIAVLADRVKMEAVVKSLIFMPMAISFVGASVIWRFVYYFQPAGRDQIGLLNALWTFIGNDPIAWITRRSVSLLGIPIPLNTLLLIIIMIWLQTGFAMVIISAAIKGVPNELLEAARIDGATEIQAFFNVTIPYIRTTIITVSTTILILVLKVFDVVFVMTSGKYDTQVIANEMYLQMFKWRDFGMGSALAVILFVAVIPVIINNIRSWQEERNIR